MAVATSGGALMRALGRVLDLPPRIAVLELRVAVDEIPTLRVTYSPELKADADEFAATVPKLYRLQEITPEEPDAAHP